MSSSVQSLIDYGSDGLIVDIECYLSNNLPNIVIVGFGNKAVDEARERVRGAFSSSGVELPRKRITINLAPADIPKASSSFDLAIAVAIMLAGAGARPAAKAKSAPQPRQLGRHEAVMGELGLDGVVRPVRGIIGKILAGRSRGLTTFYIPADNLSQACMVPDVTLVPITTLRALQQHLFEGTELATINTANTAEISKVFTDPAASLASSAARKVTSPSVPVTAADSDNPQQAGLSLSDAIGLSDVIGQHQAKRALEIAAAGGHNLLLSGPPGTGKSMLARALPSILPTLTAEEKLEVTHLHSLAGHDYDRIVAERPFRAPHHSASHISIVGGGSVLRPGESVWPTAAYCFSMNCRSSTASPWKLCASHWKTAPLPCRGLAVGWSSRPTLYSLPLPTPAPVVITVQWRPRGLPGTGQCPPAAIQRYRAKLSGPIMDRIDLYSDVHEVDHANLLGGPPVGGQQDDQTVRQRIVQARQRQSERYGNARLNSAMSNRDITRYARLEPEAKTVLDMAGRNLGLSARGYMRTVKVARTIADLESSDSIMQPHLTEALQYRSRS